MSRTAAPAVRLSIVRKQEKVSCGRLERRLANVPRRLIGKGSPVFTGAATHALLATPSSVTMTDLRHVAQKGLAPLS
jgi:hypothetical protein